MSLSFTRKIEDFTCEHCRHQVKGNGYTNHCPQCLWSKHVDICPGDREASCLGLMEPEKVVFEDNQFKILHTCVRCGHQKWNKADPADQIRDYLDRVL